MSVNAPSSSTALGGRHKRILSILHAEHSATLQISVLWNNLFGETWKTSMILKYVVRLCAQSIWPTSYYKNQSIAHVLTVLRQVSFLQSTLAELPAALTALETDLRNKGGFVHMQRLHSMVYMYGATIVEIVRRKEFSMLGLGWRAPVLITHLHR